MPAAVAWQNLIRRTRAADTSVTSGRNRGRCASRSRMGGSFQKPANLKAFPRSSRVSLLLLCRGNPKYVGPEFVELKTKPNTFWGGWVWRQPRLLGEFLSQQLECRQESHCVQGAGFSPQATCAQPAWHVPCAGSGTDVPRGRCQGGMNGAHLQVGTAALEGMWFQQRVWMLKRLRCPPERHPCVRMPVFAICTSYRGGYPCLSYPNAPSSKVLSNHSILWLTFLEEN